MISKEINTPYFDDVVYNDLPEILKKACSIYESKREKDIFLLSLLTTIGTFFPNVEGEYERKIKFPNLFAFIVGPPASGKGVMNNAKKAVDKINKEYSKTLDLPEKYQKSIFISGNVSDSEFINKLRYTKGIGIFFEAEADTIANSFKQDWGGFSDKLRKAGEHESFGKLRVSEDHEIEIEQPKLSVCISGTPDQLPKLVPSVSNGLFSRFLFYFYGERSSFRNPGPDESKVNYDQFYSELGNDLLQMYNKMPTEPIKFILGNEQFLDLTKYFIEWQDYAELNIGTDFDAVVKRYGALCYRIAQIISIYRSLESKTPIIDCIYCLEKDYQIAKAMITTLFHHTKAVYQLFAPDSRDLISQQLLELYNLLPKGQQLEIIHFDELWGDLFCARTADTKRKQLVSNGLLRKIKDGLWEVVIQN